jgi:hypothetical protein
MKNSIIALFVAVYSIFTATNSFAGGGCPSCTPVTANCTGIFGAACPSTLPDAASGTSYQQSVTFYMPATVDTTLPILGSITVPVDTVYFLGVTGLPDGMTYDVSGQIFFPEPSPVSTQFGCISICGTPCGGDQTITFTIDLLYAVTTPFGAFQLPQNFEVTFHLNSNYPVLEVTTTKSYLCPGADTATLTAQNVFLTYDWSTQETTNEIEVTASGVYELTVTDGDGCSQTASVEVFDLNADAASSTLTICQNQIAQLFGSGGETFTWSPSAGLSATNVADPVVYGLTANQTYKLVVSNGFCEDSTNVSVVVQSCTSDCTTATPNTNCSAAPNAIGAVCPNSLSAITGGVAYSDDVTFFFPAAIPLEQIVIALVGTSIPGLPNIDVSPESVVVSDVAGLPAGLNWSCDQLSIGGGGCTYYPALYPAVTQYGAISFCGTTCGMAASDTIRIILTVTATLPDAVPFLGGTQQDFDVELPVAYTLSYTNPLSISASATGTLPAGTPVTLTAASGFTGYTWQPGGQTTAAITVNTGGTYTVSANDGTCVQSVSYTVTYATGIESIDVASLNIFPNPNNGAFEVAFDVKKATDVKVGVFNVQGQEVYSENVVTAKTGKNAVNVRLNDNASGIYIVKLFVDGGAVSRRVTLY